MTIKVRRKDGSIYSLGEILGYNSYDKIPIKDNQIKIKKRYFSVDKNMRTNYAILIETSSGLFMFFSDEESFVMPSSLDHIFLAKPYKIEPATGKYSSTYLRSKIGEGIFWLEKKRENLYKIIYPRK